MMDKTSGMVIILVLYLDGTIQIDSDEFSFWKNVSSVNSSIHVQLLETP